MVSVSVVVPVYNSEKYLRECLDSILDQTFSDYEVICVDDGSTDSSREIIGAYSKKHPNFKLICQQNQYAGVARNTGIRNASGKYITFLDSDDCFEPDALEKFYRKAESTKSEVVRCPGYEFDDEGDKSEILWSLKKEYLSEEKTYNRDDLSQELFCISAGNPWGMFVRRNLIEKYGIKFLDLPRTEDIYFTYDCYLRAERISFIFEPLVYHRPSDNGMEKTKVNFPMAPLEARHAMLEKIESYGVYEKTYIGFWIAAFHSYIQMLNQIIASDSDIDTAKLYFGEIRDIVGKHPELKFDRQDRHYNEISDISYDLNKILESDSFDSFYSAEMRAAEERRQLEEYRKRKTAENFRNKEVSDLINLEKARSEHIPKEDETILFSVVIPVYNAGKYLRECLDHLINQSYTNLEIICVDDGSTDDSREIISSYPSVKLICQENSGAGIARNNGFKACSGEYVLFADGDDWVEYDLFMKVFRHLQCCNIRPDMMMYSYRRYDEVTGDFKDYLISADDPEFRLLTSLDKDPQLLLDNSLVIPWNKVLRSDFIRRYGLEYPDFKCSNDRPFYFEALAKAENILVVNDVLINYRINSKSVISRSRMDYFVCHYLTFQKVEAEYRKHSRETYERFIDVTISDMLHFYDTAGSKYKKTIGRQICEYTGSMHLDEIEDIGGYWWCPKLVQMRLDIDLEISDGMVSAAARKANRELLFRLGRRYLEYESPNNTAAAGLLMLSADKAYLPAKELLNTIYTENNAFSVCSALAEQGNRSAQYRLGKMYRDGTHVHKDPSEAKRLFLLSAEQGMNAAESAYAELCKDDEDPAELKKTFEMCLSMAKSGNKDIQFRLAKMYQMGKGTPVDLEEARKWFTVAAENGHNGAQRELELIDMQLNGKKYKTKFEQTVAELSQIDDGMMSVKYYCKEEADKGNILAVRHLARIYRDENNDAKSDEMYRRAMKMNANYVLFEFTKILFDRGSEKDLKECLQICTDYAAVGNKDALYRLGRMYYDGKGVRTDRRMAKEYFIRAAEAGSNLAAQELKPKGRLSFLRRWIQK